MAETLAEAAEDWALSLNGQALQECLEQLELQTQGSRLNQAARLQNWLLGNYTAQDFVEADASEEAVLRRLEVRQNFLKLSAEVEEGMNTSLGQETEHPLRKLLVDRVVAENLNRTTGIDPRFFQTEEEEEDERTTTANISREEDEVSSGRSAPTQTPQDTIKMVSSDGKQFEIPADFALLITDLISRVKSLQEKVEELSRPRASSTHVEGQRDNRVQFADTFTCHYDETGQREEECRERLGQHSTPRSSTARRGHTESGVGGATNRREPQTPGWHPTQGQSRQDSWLPGQSSRFTSNRDIGQIVRKWQIRFSGARNQSIDVFLARLEDCRVLANLSEEEVLSSLSELFTDTAATWYRNEKDKWTCWQDFLTAARRWYGTSKNYQQRLIAEANNRTQGADEPVRDYITCLVAIMRKLSPVPSREQMLDLLHRNLRPELQYMIRRAEVDSIETLLDLARESEQTLEYAKNQRPPPPPENTLCPEMAYKGESRSERKAPQPKVSAVKTESPAFKPEDLLAQFAKLLDEKLRPQPQPHWSQKRPDKAKFGAQKQEAKGDRPAQKKYWSRKSRSPSPKTEATAKTNVTPAASPKPQKEKKSSPPRQVGPITCHGCGLVGYRISFCPKCSGNDKRSQ